MDSYKTFDYDVLVIGAGGAGLRASIEASAAGIKVGLVCKSLLGKAHTVMAEGGIAAALSNVDDRDDWKTHFADTMRGGQYVNNYRMAELHAQEAPDGLLSLVLRACPGIRAAIPAQHVHHEVLVISSPALLRRTSRHGPAASPVLKTPYGSRPRPGGCTRWSSA